MSEWEEGLLGGAIAGAGTPTAFVVAAAAALLAAIDRHRVYATEIARGGEGSLIAVRRGCEGARTDHRDYESRNLRASGSPVPSR